MIRLNVVERATLQQSDRQVVQPNHPLTRYTRLVVFPQPLPALIVKIQG